MKNHKPNEKEIQQLLEKAREPARAAVEMHAFYRGKMSTIPKCIIRDLSDFAIWYTPGVAEPCRTIVENPEEVYRLTNKANTIAVISDGTRVLGLGDIGPEAGLPVMEGKCLLFKYLGGVDAVPIMLDEKEPDAFIETVLRLQPGFGGINLEDIAQPKCFKILDELREKAHIPVWHDDQQGTATVTLAGLMNALKVVGKNKEEIRITFIGAGAAGTACARLIFAWGVNPETATVVDVNGILGKLRTDFMQGSPAWQLCQTTNAEGKQGGIKEALQDADVVIAYSRPGPGTIEPEWIGGMADDPIVFTCANPVPEIWPWEAEAAGAAVVATGRSDFPNQVNNTLCFPAIFRGVLDVRASTISDEMCFASAQTLADALEEPLDENHILPKLTESAIFPLQAAAVGMKAQEQGLAQVKMSYDQLLDHAVQVISSAQSMNEILMNERLIPPYSEDI
jgi:malate dehydrogenase (oxaloacetate-decarboxylating)